MSELKAYIGPASDEKGLAEYYLKSEADKVIAKKDAKILALDAEVVKQKHHAKLFLDERNYAETQLRKLLAVCNDCAYGLINKGAEIDPTLLKEN